MTRGDQFRTSALDAEASAASAASADLQRQFLDLAAQWRDLADEADAFDAALNRFESDVGSQQG